MMKKQRIIILSLGLIVLNLAMSGVLAEETQTEEDLSSQQKCNSEYPHYREGFCCESDNPNSSGFYNCVEALPGYPLGLTSLDCYNSHYRIETRGEVDRCRASGCAQEQERYLSEFTVSLVLRACSIDFDDNGIMTDYHVEVCRDEETSYGSCDFAAVELCPNCFGGEVPKPIWQAISADTSIGSELQLCGQSEGGEGSGGREISIERIEKFQAFEAASREIQQSDRLPYREQDIGDGQFSQACFPEFPTAR